VKRSGQGAGREAGFAVSADEWFEVVAVEPRLHLVAEPGHVFSWLISGSERSILLDTGLGIADIAAAIRPVARSPVSVVNSHTHFDHVGGNALFGDAAMHEAGAAQLEHNCSAEELSAYAQLAAGMREAYERLEAADREGWFLLGPDQRVRPWPADPIAAAGGWRMRPPPPQHHLADGDVIELGDRRLRVIHTPGHCPEHICLLDEAAGILFAQDQIYYGPHLVYLPESNVADFARSARRLAEELRGALRAVFVAHCLRPSVPPGFLDELADAAEAVAAGEAKLVRARGLYGESVLAADFGHFSILVGEEVGS
jgi:glyoxylase-like metal-dependent hydrolase (beta-lactamase superfamily II)